MKIFKLLIITIFFLWPFSSIADCCYKKIIDYGTLSGDFNETLSEKVKRYIKEGWQPLGGLGCSNYGCFQAIVKYEEVKDERV